MKRRTHTTNLIKYILIIIVLFGCKNADISPSTNILPSIIYHQYELGYTYSYQQDTLIIKLDNPLHCPVRISFFSSNEQLQNAFNKVLPITLNPVSDTVLTFTNILKKGAQLSFSSNSSLGSISKKIDSIQLGLPFLKNKKYSIIQGNNTNFTHNTDWSRYALDFDLKTNDTVCSATDGYVVGIVDQYKYAGSGPEWEPFANFLTIYEPNSGIFTQYVHLTQNGSLVKMGDNIKRGQKIALSGNTGYTTGEHLHFSSLVPVNSEDGLKSIPIEFIGGIKGVNLKQGDVLENN